MADLFVVQPYNHYEYLGDKLLRYLKAISNKSEKILFQCTSTTYQVTRLFVYNNNPAIKIYEHMGSIRNRKLNDMYLIND